MGPDNSDEGKLRSHYIDLTTRGLVNVCNPQSKDYLIFDEPYQPLVDAAHLAEGLIRSKTQIWNRIESDGQHMILDALKKTVTSGTVVMVNMGMDLISTWIIIIAMLFIQC